MHGHLLLVECVPMQRQTRMRGVGHGAAFSIGAQRAARIHRLHAEAATAAASKGAAIPTLIHRRTIELDAKNVYTRQQQAESCSKSMRRQ